MELGGAERRRLIGQNHKRRDGLFVAVKKSQKTVKNILQYSFPQNIIAVRGGKVAIIFGNFALMIILVVPRLNANGMALWPFVLVRLPNPGPFLLNHERIHHRQQVEMGVLPFYVVYLLEYAYRRWIEKRSHHGAYMALSFEREAYAHDRDLTYLKRRKLWAFWRYL